MSLKDLNNIKAGYDSGFDNILNDFYVPVLREAKLYKRIAGFFSSSSLSVAARGITGLIKNGGRMQMIVSPRLAQKDIEIIEKSVNNPQEVIEKVLLRNIDDVENLLQKKRIEALGWLIANNYLEIKVATMYDNNGKLIDENKVEESGLFHIKVGIIEDIEGNTLTFSGSVNETASAWVRNIEEFKVFKDWEPGQQCAAKIDIEKFENYWNGKVDRVEINNLPKVVEKHLIKNAPQDIVEVENQIIEEEQKENRSIKLNFKPFEYQLEALEIWQKERKAIFEMATGTGKTKTAQLCIADFINNCEETGVIFIVCPQNTLAKQWLKDIEESGIPCSNYVFCDSTESKWKDKKMGEGSLAFKLLELGIRGVSKDRFLFVFVTFDTFYSDKFKNIVIQYKGNSKYFIIGDEVHGLGSVKRLNGLINEYDYRLGLSATPERWFDEYGTQKITEFFGTERYIFSLRDALNKINPLTGKSYLTPYDYKPVFINLEPEELMEYKRCTEQIIKELPKIDDDYDAADIIEKLIFKRANIYKSARNKLEAFKKILDDLGNNIDNTIIFVSPDQIDSVEEILRERNIFVKRFTKEQGKKPLKKYGDISEREHILEMFKEGDCKALLAIKCLDEGIDVPEAKRAIILSSSTNPREYIQRIGRVIRRSKGKKKAEIYDVIVEPSWQQLNAELKAYENKIFSNEMKRVLDISENATNRLDIINTIYSKVL